MYTSSWRSAGPARRGSQPQPDRDRVAVLEPGLLIAGRYQVLRVIAYGGMSVVHLALDVRLGRRVALKLLQPGTVSPTPNEARLGARFAHPSLVTVFDSGAVSVAGRSFDFIVMELASEGDLRDRLFDHGAMQWRDVAQLGVALCEGLAYLHAEGYLHRDIKPANVLLTGVDAGGTIRAKLTDFGLSSRGRTYDTTYGTAAYVSPEQVHGAPVDAASDVYSLGLVLLEALTGRVEFPGRVEHSALSRLVRRPLVPDSVPRPVAATISAMTEMRPDHRSSAAQAAVALREALVDEWVRGRGADPELLRHQQVVRTTALDRLGVLDWPPLQVFDAAVGIAARLCGPVEACLVLRAREGAHVSAATASHLTAMLGSPDWLFDEQRRERWTFADLANMQDEKARSFALTSGMVSVAGVSLVTSDGVELGSLCAFSGRKDEFSGQMLDDLGCVADLVVHDLELRLAARRAVLAQ